MPALKHGPNQPALKVAGNVTTIRYKGFTIQTRPYQTHVSKQWTVDLEIHRNGLKRLFTLDEHYPTQQEAEARCSALGRRIIDGKIAGWSVDKLRATGFLQRFGLGNPRRLAAAGQIVLNLGILLVFAWLVLLFLGGL